MRWSLRLAAAVMALAFGAVSAHAQSAGTTHVGAKKVSVAKMTTKVTQTTVPRVTKAKAKRKVAARTTSARARVARRGTSTRMVRPTVRSDGTAVAAWSSGASMGSVGPRPRRWCGWWMRTQRGGGPELNVAWNWSKWGRPTTPQVGAVVVWRHHVGEIVGQNERGQWLVRSGNDSNAVRTRPWNLRGAVFRI